MVGLLLGRPDLIELVDEFFFEFHFRCEIMSRCGWGDVPQVGSLGNDRFSAMKLFSELRKKGVRAHFWP